MVMSQATKARVIRDTLGRPGDRPAGHWPTIRRGPPALGRSWLATPDEIDADGVFGAFRGLGAHLLTWRDITAPAAYPAGMRKDGYGGWFWLDSWRPQRLAIKVPNHTPQGAKHV